LDGLADLWISDAEQLIAAASIAFIQPLIARRIGITPQQMEDVLKELQGAIPARRLAEVKGPISDEFALGALDPTLDMLQASLAIKTSSKADAAGLPGGVNWAPEMPPIRDQGQRGTCVAFGATAVNEFPHSRPIDLSEQYLYARIKQIDGVPNECGTWLAKAVVVLAANGECREALMPYNPNPPCNQNDNISGSADADALNYRVPLNQLNPHDVNGFKIAVANHKVVGFCIPVYNSWYQSGDTYRTGRITMRIGNEPAIGGHCMCVVGYQDDSGTPGGGYFIIRNSWGTVWAYQSPYGAGNGTIPYQYIANDGNEAATLP
jgi:C1A family cysteine protease